MDAELKLDNFEDDDDEDEEEYDHNDEFIDDGGGDEEGSDKGESSSTDDELDEDDLALVAEHKEEEKDDSPHFSRLRKLTENQDLFADDCDNWIEHAELPDGGVSTEQMSLIRDLFGDANAVLTILGTGTMEPVEDEKTPSAPQLERKTKPPPEAPSRLQQRFEPRFECPEAALTDEAEWLTLRLMAKDEHEEYMEGGGETSDVVAAVTEVLKYFIHEKLEPRVVIDYRMHFLEPLKAGGVHAIYNMDVDYWKMKKATDAVRTQLGDLGENLTIGALLKEATYLLEDEVVDDVRCYVSTHYPESKKSVRGRRISSSVVEDKYNIAHNWEHSLMSPDHFNANVHQLLDKMLDAEPDKQFTAKYGPPDGPSDEEVPALLESLRGGSLSTISAVRNFLILRESKRLASMPHIRRSLRRAFRSKARVTTTTTVEGEPHVDPSMTRWWFFRLLREPVQTFLGPAIPAYEIQEEEATGNASRERMLHNAFRKMNRRLEAFVDLACAEKMGHVEITIHPLAPEDDRPWRKHMFARRPLSQKCAEDERMDLLKADDDDAREIQVICQAMIDLYASPTPSTWRDIQEQIINRVVTTELWPTFRREMKQMLTRHSEDHVIRCCGDTLGLRMMERGFDDGSPFIERVRIHDSDDSDAEKEREITGTYDFPRVASFVVDKSVFGVLLDRQGEVVKTVTLDFIMNENMPKERLEDEERIKNFLFSQFIPHPNVVVIGASSPLSMQFKDVLGSMTNNQPIPMYFRPMDIAQVFATSSRQRVQRKGMAAQILQAISLGRLIQDPIAEISHLWSVDTATALRIKMHPLQEHVPQQKLEYELFGKIQNAVCHTGVDINRIRLHPHLQGPLQFLPGLCPETSTLMSQWIAHTPVRYRRQLFDDSDPDAKAFKSSIFRNFAGYIRIRSSDEQVDVLDETRIHPFWGSDIAASICAKLSPKGVEDPIGHVISNKVVISDDLLDEFHRKSEGLKPKFLEFIRRELEEPFKDLRDPLCELTSEELFRCVTNDAAFDYGSPVMVRITDKTQALRGVVQPTGVFVELPDSARRLPNVRVGAVVNGRVFNVRHVDCSAQVQIMPDEMESLVQTLLYDEVEFSVSCVARNPAWAVKQQADDPEEEVEKDVKLTCHRDFRVHATREIMEAPIYTCLFTKGQNQNIIGLFKVSDRPMNIKRFAFSETGAEYEKGKSLRLDDREYENLDHFQLKFIEPLKRNLKELSHLKYFHAKKMKDLCVELQQSEGGQSDYIKWGLCLVNQQEVLKSVVRCALVTAIPNRGGERKLYTDHLDITPHGFCINDSPVRPSLTSLVSWWKQEGFRNRLRRKESKSNF